MRIPSFNDFSPVILQGDIRKCLEVIERNAGNDAAIVKAWAALFFGGVENKRSSTNIPATLRSTGLIAPGRPLALSEQGKLVLAAPDPISAAREFCKGIIRDKNGMQLVDAIRALTTRRDPVTKASLKAELNRQGVDGLSTNTTDHTTLKNWMHLAGILTGPEREPLVDDVVLKALTGISGVERGEFGSLTQAQQIFVELIRRRHVVESGPFAVRDLLQECLRTHPHLFSESQFAKEVRGPLADANWIEVQKLAAGPQGGKSGFVRGTAKLVGIPLDNLVPNLDAAIPGDLRAKMNIPLAEIGSDLDDLDTYKRGVALELLALRMIWDLGLQPRGFRLRSAQTAYAEVDLTAEGSHLLFSRWSFQCKNTKVRVALGDVAKEVGIAIYSKAHVVAMVTTSDFSRDAYDYAREITRATHLQFLFITGDIVRSYLTNGRSILLKHALDNAEEVMREKRVQQLPKPE